MRIKVVWKEFKFVIPTGKSIKVSDFCKEISSKFSAYSQEEFFVSELKTVDGFIISPHLLVEEALVENDILVVIDFESWKNEQYKLCNKTFQTFQLENFEDNNSLRVNVGLNTMNKLYVSIGLYNKLYRLELFDAADLKAFHKEGDHPITHWEDGKGSYAKVYFVVADGVVKQVKSEILTVSAQKPLISSIDIKVTSNNKIEEGEVKVIQKAYQPYDSDADVTKLPEEVRVGKSFIDYDNYDYYTTDGGNGSDASTHAIVTSSSDVRFEQVDIVRAEMGNYATNNGGFWNSFFTDFQITNNADQRVTLSKITAEYQDKEGNWQPMFAVFGTKRSNQVYDYTWRNDNILIPLDSRDTIKLSTNTRVEIKGKNSERLSRSDKSLPNELHIKVHIHDDKQNVTTIPLFYKNKTEDPVTMTLKTRQARVDQPIVFFQTVDNFETNVRGYVQITTSTDDSKNIYVFSSNCSNSSYYISESTLHSFVYQAKKSNEKVYRIKNYCDSNSNFSVEVFANINFETSRVDSLIFELSDKNGNSKSTKHFPITKYICSK